MSWRDSVEAAKTLRIQRIPAGDAMPGPTITSVTPSTGPEAGGTFVTVIGTALRNTRFVRLDAGAVRTPSNVDVPVIHGDTRITFTTRAWEPSGSHVQTLFLTTPYGVASFASAFTFDGVDIGFALLTEAGEPLTTEAGEILEVEH